MVKLPNEGKLIRDTGAGDSDLSGLRGSRNTGKWVLPALILLMTGFWTFLHVRMVGYPGGAWNDDWLAYYASSHRYLSDSGPLEIARVTSKAEAVPGAGTFYDRLLLNALLSPADPYLLWGVAHAQIIRFMHLSPHSGFLVLQVLGTGLYFLSLVVFARSCIRGLAPAGFRWIIVAAVALQLSYFGSLLFVGPSLFIPAMFLLPCALLFFATFIYPAGAIWRVVLIAAMLLVHSTGLIVVTWCLMGSAFYVFLSPRKWTSIVPEFACTAFFYLLMQAASRMSLMPTLYPESVDFFELGFDFYGAISTIQEIKLPFLVACVILPWTAWRLRREIRVDNGAALLIAFWGSFIVSSLGLISLRVKEGVYHIPLHRYYYAAWPALVFSLFLVLMLSMRTANLPYRKLVFGLLSSAIVVWNLTVSYTFWENVSHWRQNSSCRFLYDFLADEIPAVSRIVPDFVSVFDTKVAGSALLLAGAADKPALYTRMTPKWVDRVTNGFKSNAVLTVMPLSRFLPFSDVEKPVWWNELRDGTGPLPPVSLESSSWRVIRDSVVSQSRVMPIETPPTLDLIRQWTARFSADGPTCDRPNRDSLYRVTLYQKTGGGSD